MLWNRKSIIKIITEVGDIIMAEELTKFAKALPANIEDLSTFVVVGREKLVALQAELRAISKVGMVDEIRKQKLSEAQDLADELLLAEVRLGEIISELPEMPGKRTDLQPVDTDVQRSKKEVLQEIGISIKTAQRYERLAKHPEIVASVSAEARSEGDIVSRASVLRAITQSNKPYITNSSGFTEWYTPKKYIESARIVFGGGIDLDPASSAVANETTVRADKYYTEKEDGLKQEWYGNVWLNPPYSQASDFVDKLLSSDITQAIALVNNCTETAWFAKMVHYAKALVFHTGRMRFDCPTKDTQQTSAAMQGQVFAYFGSNEEVFLEEFSQYGWGVRL